MKSLQNEYNLIKEGKGNKELFIKEARTLFPNIVTNVLTFDQSIHNLAERGIISEGFTGELSQREGEPNWFKIFSENTEAVKATLKDTDKSAVKKETAGYNYEDRKNNNNLSTEEILNGYYVEMKDPKNADKTEQELKNIVFKNLEKDPLFYVKNAAFGIKGIGYSEDHPGLGPTKEVTGKYKSSGMEPVKLNEAMYGSSDGDYEADQEAEQMAYYYYDKGLEAYSEGDFLRADRYYTTALRHGSYLGFTEVDLTPYSEVSLNESKHGDEAELGILKSELKMLNKIKTTAERHTKRKAELEKKIADLEAKEEPIKENTNEIPQADWQFVYDWVNSHATKWANKNGINNAGALKSMFTKDTPSNMISIIDRETDGKFGQLPKVKRMFTMPEGEHKTKNNMENKTTLSEAKKRRIDKDLAEIDKLGEVAAIEYKMGKIQEKIEELKNRLTMTESDDMKEMVDKKAVKEIKNDIAYLEKTKKMYEAKKAKAAKRVSGDTVKPQAVGGEEVLDEAKAPMWEEAMKSVLKKRGY